MTGSGVVTLLDLPTRLELGEETFRGVVERRRFCLGEGDTLLVLAFARSGCIFFHAATIFLT